MQTPHTNVEVVQFKIARSLRLRVSISTSDQDLIHSPRKNWNAMLQSQPEPGVFQDVWETYSVALTAFLRTFAVSIVFVRGLDTTELRRPARILQLGALSSCSGVAALGRRRVP